MRARIEEIRIRNFRTLENVRLTLRELTFLVGRNGAGKSSILDALELIREALTDSLPNALLRRDGFDSVARAGRAAVDGMGFAVVMRAELQGRTVRMLYGFEVGLQGFELQIREALRVSPMADQGFVRVDNHIVSDTAAAMAVPRERLLLPIGASNELWLAALETLSHMYAYEIAPRSVASASPVRGSTNLDRTGLNAGDVLDAMAPRLVELGELTQSLQAVVPGIVGVTSRAMRGLRVIYFDQKVGSEIRTFSADVMSQGTLRCLGMLLALYQKPEPSLVLIDEVEDSIHPVAVEAIIEAAEGFAERFPVILTTHSPEVLSRPQVTPDRVHIVQWDDGVSHLYPLSEGTKDSVDKLTSVGDLLRFNAVWPGETPERFEGDILELVE